MRRWMVAASLVLAGCGARSGLVPGVGGSSNASGGTPGSGGGSFGGNSFGGSSFGGTGGVATGGSGFGGSGFGGSGFGGTGFGGGGFGGAGFGGAGFGGGGFGGGGAPGSGGSVGSGGTPSTCDPAFCPSDGVATPCCMTAQGPCGFDQGNGCENPGMCSPPSPGATCDQVSSGNAKCDACMHANCCDAISNCFADPACVAMAQCSIQHGCFGLPEGQFENCLFANCNATSSSIGPYKNAILCGQACCASVCP